MSSWDCSPLLVCLVSNPGHVSSLLLLPQRSGRRRGPAQGSAGIGVVPPPSAPAPRMPPPLATILLLVSTVLSIAEACSSRSTPKPRPPSPTARPNITFHTYACPPAYAKWYCLNEATCFTVKIGESLLYNCECADGFMGQRCEFKDLDGSYLPSRQQVMLETASIAGGATIAVFLVVIVCLAVYIHFQRKQKESRASCFVDGSSRDMEEIRPFSRSLAISMTHQQTHPLTELALPPDTAELQQQYLPNHPLEYNGENVLCGLRANARKKHGR